MTESTPRLAWYRRRFPGDDPAQEPPLRHDGDCAVWRGNGIDRVGHCSCGLLHTLAPMESPATLYHPYWDELATIEAGMIQRIDPLNQVRQVLMNELGLTRASVREMVADIVDNTVERKLNEMLDAGLLNKVVLKKLDDRLAAGSNAGRLGGAPSDIVSQALVAAAKELAKDFIEKNFEIVAKET